MNEQKYYLINSLFELYWNDKIHNIARYISMINNYNNLMV